MHFEILNHHAGRVNGDAQMIVEAMLDAGWMPPGETPEHEDSVAYLKRASGRPDADDTARLGS